MLSDVIVKIFNSHMTITECHESPRFLHIFKAFFPQEWNQMNVGFFLMCLKLGLYII